MPPRPGSTHSLGLLLLLLAGSLVCTAAMLLREHETIRASGPGAILFILGVAVTVLVAFAFRRPSGRRQRMARDLAEYVGLFGMTCMIGAVASYPDAAASSGYVDRALERADRTLHFDWIGMYQIVADHPLLQVIGAAAYQSIYITPAVLFGYYAWTNRRAEAHRFILAFWLAAIITLVLFAWLPAAGPLAYLWHGPIRYMPQSALYQAQLIPALRSHAGREVIDLDALHGLVSAPSFHAASGILFIAFAWRLPRVGKPLVALNLLMLASTPIEGTHYLIDVLGGMMVALCAAALTLSPVGDRVLWRRMSARPEPVSAHSGRA